MLLLAVADGMGGLSAGEQASATALQTLHHHLLQHLRAARSDGLDELALERALNEGFQRAHQAIRTVANLQELEMGTTLTVACVTPGQAHLCHAGDSRCYLARDGEVRRMTHDDTVAAALVRRDLARADQITRRWGHVLTNVVGTNAGAPTVEHHLVRLERGDLLLLCTDGVTRYLSDQQIALHPAQRSPRQICNQLIGDALTRGGEDDLTVIAARC